MSTRGLTIRFRPPGTVELSTGPDPGSHEDAAGRARQVRGHVVVVGIAPGSGSVRDPVSSAGYCAVTVVCGVRRLDAALPTAVPVADLQPSLLRLLLPDGPPAAADPWVLVPIGRADLEGSETLSSAAILAGDILELRQRSTPDPAGSPVLDTRDRIEDVVNGHGRFWNPRASYGLAHWTALLAGGALLIPAARLPGGLPAAGLAATVAVIVTMTAVLAGRRSEKVCAAVGVAIGCGWAAFVGWQLCQGWLLTGAAGLTGPAVLPVTLAVASGCALLLAGGAAVTYPAALVHACALMVVGVGCAVVTLAARMGGPLNETACVAALSAVLVIGGLPRVALAIGGLGGEARSGAADLDARITRADRVLLGCLIGVGMVAAGGAIPAALIGDGWLRLLATGIGLLLLLRSRAFSRTPQVLAARIAGMLVIGCLWVGMYRGDPELQAVLILGAALSTAALTIGAAVTSPAGSPVGRARAGRTLDLAEQLLVVALIVLAAGVSGLFDWVSSVIG